jgi:hypothetical protein
MKKSEVHIGAVYVAKVSDKLTRVRLESECPYGGWYATNLGTDREVHIRSAAKLRKEVIQVPLPLSPKIRL